VIQRSTDIPNIFLNLVKQQGNSEDRVLFGEEAGKQRIITRIGLRRQIQLLSLFFFQNSVTPRPRGCKVSIFEGLNTYTAK